DGAYGRRKNKQKQVIQRVTNIEQQRDGPRMVFSDCLLLYFFLCRTRHVSFPCQQPPKGSMPWSTKCTNGSIICCAPGMSQTVWTIGHSTRSLDEFLALLKGYEIEAIADVRSHPGSRKYPHFGQEALAAALRNEGLAYDWFQALGGQIGRASCRESRESGVGE